MSCLSVRQSIKLRWSPWPMYYKRQDNCEPPALRRSSDPWECITDVSSLAVAPTTYSDTCSSEALGSITEITLRVPPPTSTAGSTASYCTLAVPLLGKAWSDPQSWSQQHKYQVPHAANRHPSLWSHRSIGPAHGIGVSLMSSSKSSV